MTLEAWNFHCNKNSHREVTFLYSKGSLKIIILGIIFFDVTGVERLFSWGESPVWEKFLRKTSSL